jgi:hypothetical protein
MTTTTQYGTSASYVVEAAVEYFRRSEYVLCFVCNREANGDYAVYRNGTDGLKTPYANRLLHAARGLCWAIGMAQEAGVELENPVMYAYCDALEWLNTYGPSEWKNIPLPYREGDWF